MRYFLCVQLLFITGALTESKINDGPIFDTPNGQILGEYRLSTKGRRFAAFEGVPYAEPPLGELRFAESIPKKPWSGVWTAKRVHQCFQVDHEPKDLGAVVGSEDCLYVNVYTPVLNPKTENKKLPVIVHFHSGAFMWGRGDIYGANHLMDRDVVFINLNYRLGPLGFLTTGDDVLPGNNGMKDQVLALRWIQRAISSFGGDPNSVTLSGLSAGGVSTHYHIISPMSRGLFHRGISVSGTALCNWGLAENAVEKTHILSRAVGCSDKNSAELVKCLRQRPATQIIGAMKLFQPWLYNPYSPFAPVVGDSFLPEHPYEILRKGKAADVPWITSVTSEEGLYPAAQFIYNDTWLPYLEKHWLELAPYILHFDNTVPADQQKEVSKKIKDYYLKGQPISRQTYGELVQAIGDRLFVVDSEKAARIQAKVNESPVYYYRFSYRGDHSYSEYFTGTTEDVGVCHADDLMYIAYPDKSWFTTYMQSDKDKKMSQLLIDIWMSFIKTGKPSVPVKGGGQWKPVSKNLSGPFRYLQITSPEEITMETAQSLGHRPFWDSLPFQENEKLFAAKDEL